MPGWLSTCYILYKACVALDADRFGPLSLKYTARLRSSGSPAGDNAAGCVSRCCSAPGMPAHNSCHLSDSAGGLDTQVPEPHATAALMVAGLRSASTQRAICADEASHLCKRVQILRLGSAGQAVVIAIIVVAHGQRAHTGAGAPTAAALRLLREGYTLDALLLVLDQ